ncbi:hypothetical protein [Xanthomonas oryzae]|uniref:hypothetical protein n=1 Tax=Xanthomonas oryzae TaxID=347 RepID=UPI002D1E44AB|nr:hypothetical protein [Xanthomonas oryzae]
MLQLKVRANQEIDCDARFSDSDRYVSPVLFRGQSRAGWKLETTLERFGKRDLSIEEYARYLAKVKPGIEAYTDRVFEFNLGNPKVSGSTFPLSQISLSVGQYEFMVYLVAPEKPLSNLQCHVCGPHGA